jgi:general nucleoside transport system permease protein
MAKPTVQGRNSLPASKSSLWLRKAGASLARPVAAVILALLIAGVVIACTTSGSFGVRISTALQTYYYLVQGAFGNAQNICYTLADVTPLIFAGLSVAIAFRAGLFNIGAAGQLTVGTVVAGTIGLYCSALPGFILIPLMIIAAALSGAIWGAIVGFLKAWRGAHEVVTTIMLNWTAFYVASFLIEGPLQAKGLSAQSAPMPGNAQLPMLSILYNQTLGTFLPQINSPLQYMVDFGIILALITLVIYWFITARMTFGYELRVIGENPRAAQYAGIPVKRNLVLAMALAGAFAGLAGAIHLMGQPPYQLLSTFFRTDSTGSDAIGVALLGRTTSIGVLLAALLFGGLANAGTAMQLSIGIPSDITYIIQALVLLSIATEFLPAVRRVLPRYLGGTRKPLPATNELVPNVIAVETPLPVDASKSPWSQEE